MRVERTEKVVKVEAIYSFHDLSSKEIEALRDIFYKVAFAHVGSATVRIEELSKHSEFAMEMMEQCDVYLQNWMSEVKD